MRKQKLDQRPSQIRLDNRHPLANELVFAGLSPSSTVGSTLYKNSSPRGRDGTLTNMTPATNWVWSSMLDRFALNFVSASTQSVVCTPPSVLNSSTTVTMAAWMKRAASGSTVTTTIHTSNSASRLQISLWSDTGSYFSVSDTNYAYGYSVAAGTEWTHLAMVFTGAGADNPGRVKGFINGSPATLAFTGTVPAAAPSSLTTFKLGVDSLATYWTDGQIADVMVWNRALSASEIAPLAESRNVTLSGLILPARRKLFKGVTLAPASTAKAVIVKQRKPRAAIRQRAFEFRLDNQHPLAKGLVYAGLANKAGSRQYFDSSPYKNRGDFNGMSPETDWVYDSYLDRWVIDTSASGARYVEVSNSSSLQLTGAFSLSFWGKFAAVDGAWASPIAKGGWYGESGNYEVLFNAGSNIVRLYRNATGVEFGSIGLTANKWDHWSFTNNGSTTTCYKNGIPFTPLSQTSGTETNNLTLKLGYEPSGYKFPGQLADILIHSRCLGSAEVAELANPANSMISGLIVPPRRKLFAVPGVGGGENIVVGGGTPTATTSITGPSVVLNSIAVGGGTPTATTSITGPSVVLNSIAVGGGTPTATTSITGPSVVLNSIAVGGGTPTATTSITGPNVSAGGSLNVSGGTPTVTTSITGPSVVLNSIAVSGGTPTATTSITGPNVSAGGSLDISGGTCTATASITGPDVQAGGNIVVPGGSCTATASVTSPSVILGSVTINNLTATVTATITGPLTLARPHTSRLHRVAREIRIHIVR